MSMIQSDLLLGQEGGAGYVVERSLRFNASDSAFLSRTPASAGNRKTWTWAGWVKRSALGTNQAVSSAYASSPGRITSIRFVTTDKLSITINDGTSASELLSLGVFRDTSAWYHILVACDTTQATNTNRIKIYINGAQISTDTGYPNQNIDTLFNLSSQVNNLGQSGESGYEYYFNGYLADIHFIDGQALDPSSFVETSATTGQLIPKAYTGTFTGNSFWLKFADNSAATATTLGKDSSGLGNNWTPNNLSVTAGAGNDSLVDTPTSYGTDTGAGSEVRGNYATLNPLAIFGGTNATKSYGNGNLEMTATSNNNLPTAVGTIAPGSGKWYAEVTAGHATNGIGFINVANLRNILESAYSLGQTSDGWLRWDYRLFNNASVVQTGLTSIVAGDIVQIALDLDNGKAWFGINNTWDSGSPSAGTSPTATFTAAGKEWVIGTAFRNDGVSVTATINFGQRQWTYAAPAGFKALCTTNLPEPTIALPSTVMDVKLYTGNSSTQTISGFLFSPDFVWLKQRTNPEAHGLFDTVRGAQKSLASGGTGAENATDTNSLTAFTSDGFSLGNTSRFNDNTYAHVAWAWDAGSSTSTNNSGSISSQVRANASAGFSVVTFTYPSSGSFTVGHGLNATPGLIITKHRTRNVAWFVYHSVLGKDQRLSLNTTGAAVSDPNFWGSAAISSTTFGGTVGTSGISGDEDVAYCFAPVAGHSSFGSYVGNGSADGPFVYTGFRPRFLLIKGSSVANTDWAIIDTARDTYNIATDYLAANSSGAEQTLNLLDVVSNGFKIKAYTDSTNQNNQTYVWAAWAESPFQYARAR